MSEGRPPAADRPHDDGVAQLAERFGVVTTVSQRGGVRVARYGAASTASAPGVRVSGFGSGRSQEEATVRAVMECVERFVLATGHETADCLYGSMANLEGAVDPRAFGLYSEAQYRTPGFPCARFSPDGSYEWVTVRDVESSSTALVPVEWVYPRFCRRPPLVRETSSGTAAHTSLEVARTSALCELVERDAFMRFWYRHEHAEVVPVHEFPPGELRDDLDALVGEGFVVTAARLRSDIPLPVCCVLVERGNRFAFGMGCAFAICDAMLHALRETSASLGSRWEPPDAAEPRDVQDVRTPHDHAALYSHAPFSRIRRAFFAQALRPARSWETWFEKDDSGGDWRAATDIMGEAGFRVLEHVMLTNRAGGASVVRVLVPGLVPIHFGFGMERIGCRRLVEPGAGSRLRTLLPHCFA
jgi:ribosomal protein S12 methylthiotransferase accessory factor